MPFVIWSAGKIALSFTAACFSREKGYSLMIKTADRKNLSAVVFLRWEKGLCPTGFFLSLAPKVP